MYSICHDTGVYVCGCVCVCLCVCVCVCVFYDTYREAQAQNINNSKAPLIALPQ